MKVELLLRTVRKVIRYLFAEDGLGRGDFRVHWNAAPLKPHVDVGHPALVDISAFIGTRPH